MQDPSNPTYQPPSFRTYAQRKQEKERLLALAAGRHDDGGRPGITFPTSTIEGYRVSSSDEDAFSLDRNSATNLPYSPSQQSALIPVGSSDHPAGHPPTSYGHAPHMRTSPLNAEHEQFHSGHALPAAFNARDMRRIPTDSFGTSRVSTATTLPARPLSTSTSTTISSLSSKRPLPSPAGPSLVNAAMNRVTTAPVVPGHRTAGMSPLPTLHHFASQPDLTSNRQTCYNPQFDLQAYPGAMRATPSIPNLRHSHVISPPFDPPSAENIIRRPLPKPAKTRSSTLTSIPEPPNPQAVALVSSTSSSHVPQSAPVLQTDCDSSWTDSTPFDHQTAPRAMDRSDTLASVKSLDRWDLSQTTKQKTTTGGRERPLPSAPGLHQARGLATSRSLDRGNLRNGTHPPRILALTPASNTKMHGCSDATVESGMSSVPAHTLAALVLPREDTYLPSISPKQPADSASNALETLQKQINSAMADFRINDRPVDRNTESADATTSKATNADHFQTKRLAKQSDGNDFPQVAPISLNGIPTIVFPDSEEESPTIVAPAARITSPGPPAGHASALPAIAIKIATEDAEKMPTPAMNVSERGRELENSAVQSLPVVGTSISDPRAPSQPRAGAASDEALPSPVTCGIFCHACDLVILGNIVNAMEKGWHPACFKCTTCRMPLEHVSSFEHEGKPYCHMDYHEQFAPKCHHCNTPIIDQRFITIDDSNFGKRFYHELHFFCGECGIPFLDPSQSSSAGTELKGRGDQGDPAHNHEEEQTAAFVIHGKHAFCPECDITLHRPKCKGCRKPIRSEDEALEALKAKWHRACFKCTSCQETIPTKHFVPIDRKPYCQDCYASQT